MDKQLWGDVRSANHNVENKLSSLKLSVDKSIQFIAAIPQNVRAEALELEEVMGFLYGLSTALGGKATEILKIGEDRIVRIEGEKYNHGRQIHARNVARQFEKKPRPAPLGQWELSAPQNGRDMHNAGFVEALCPHGIGHHMGVHGCDGCCAHAPIEIWEKVSQD